MDHVNPTRSSNTTNNYEPNGYEPNTCDNPVPVTEPTECSLEALEGDVFDAASFDAGGANGSVCSVTGLKGPATAVQLYTATLNGETSTQPTAESTTFVRTEESTSAKQAAAVSARLDEVRDTALEHVRTLVTSLAPEAGHEFSRSIALPNGCELSVGIEAVVEANGELVTNAVGRIKGNVGTVGGEVEFSYSLSQNGAEAVSFEACIFGGVDQQIGLARAEAKVGVCGTYSDTSKGGAELQLDAVAQVGTGFDLQLLQWEYEVKVRQPISRDNVAFEVLP